MMFVLLRPTERAIRALLETCSDRPPNAPGLESVDLSAPPEGFDLDEYGVVLGRGHEVWTKARAALDAWAMYPRPWVTVYANGDTVASTSAFVAVVRHFGFHSLLPCRVREAYDTPAPHHRYGFAFLTLAGHAERGVERFDVSWDERTDEVRFDVTAISRPAGIVRLGRPIARWLQARFRRDAVASMRRAVADAAATSN